MLVHRSPLVFKYKAKVLEKKKKHLQSTLQAEAQRAGLGAALSSDSVAINMHNPPHEQWLIAGEAGAASFHYLL